MIDDAEAGALAESLYEKARAAMNAGEIDVAVELFERSVAAEPHFKTYELLGECYLIQKLPIKATTNLAAALGLGNRAFRALYLLAQALWAIGKDHWAIQKLEDAVEMQPDFRSARELLGRLRVEYRETRGYEWEG